MGVQERVQEEHKRYQVSGNGIQEQYGKPFATFNGDEAEAAALIADPGGTPWKDSVLEDKMKSRFPKSYDLFLDTIYDIKYTVDDLKEELGVKGDRLDNIEPKHVRFSVPLKKF